MIKFFRKIRYDLMENKTGKYFKYAIGEIVLVVIGILIALQINNWNESRKDKINLDNIYAMIISDLENDIKEIDNILNHYKKREPYYIKVANGTFNEADYSICDCQGMFLGYPDFYINTRGFNLLNQKSNNYVRNNQLTDDILNFYNQNFIELEISDETLTHHMYEIRAKWSEHEWWSEFRFNINDQGFSDYLIYNKNAKNEVADFSKSALNVYLPALQFFRKGAVRLIGEIEKRQ